MSQQFALAVGAPQIGAGDNAAASIFAANWRTSSVVACANTATNKPSTHKHFAFAASYAAYAKRGSWSPIG